jgi:hypothetical protein
METTFWISLIISAAKVLEWATFDEGCGEKITKCNLQNQYISKGTIRPNNVLLCESRFRLGRILSPTLRTVSLLTIYLHEYHHLLSRCFYTAALHVFTALFLNLDSFSQVLSAFSKHTRHFSNYEF